MSRYVSFTVIACLLLLYSCQKEEQSEYTSSGYYGGNWPTFYYYYYLNGIATDSSGNSLNGVILTMNGPCYPTATTNNQGYFFLRTCEMDSKWSFYFQETITVFARDTADYSTVLATTEFPSDLLIENDTVEINLQFPL